MLLLKGYECVHIALCCVLSAGTRIIYDRKFLLDRRNSPIAQTPPAHLPVIPGVTSQNVKNENKKNEANNINNHDAKPGTGQPPLCVFSSLPSESSLHQRTGLIKQPLSFKKMPKKHIEKNISEFYCFDWSECLKCSEDTCTSDWH